VNPRKLDGLERIDSATDSKIKVFLVDPRNEKKEKWRFPDQLLVIQKIFKELLAKK